MKKSEFKPGDKSPDIEINKPAERKFWQQPRFNLWKYALILLSFYLWQGYFKQEKFPYSQFLSYPRPGRSA